MSDSYTARDILDFAVQGDAAKVGDAFKVALADRLQKKLEDKKIEMAQSIFASSTPKQEVTAEPEPEQEQSKETE